MKIQISRESSEIKFVYNDKLRALLDEGDALTVRASNVEMGADGCWIADLRPSGGKVVTGFRFRQEALDFEKNWLESTVIDSSESLKP